MKLEDKIRYHCQLVVEYKDVDKMFSKKNVEIVHKLFFELLYSQLKCPFTLFYEVVSTILHYSTLSFSISKQQATSIEIPKSTDKLLQFFSLIISEFPRSCEIVPILLYWCKQNNEIERTELYKDSLIQCLEACLQHSQKLLALECALFSKTVFNNDQNTTEELNTTIIALLASLGLNEEARNFHCKFIEEQNENSTYQRSYNVFLTYLNERNNEFVLKLWNEIDVDTLPVTIRRNYQRLYALHLARNQQNNEAKELLEQLANVWIEEKNTKEYIKIHNDIVSIIPNENVEKFSEYLTTVENIFEQSLSKQYLLTVYAKKHEYAKLQNKYEAISLAKSFLLAQEMNAYSILEEVSFQLSELAKKRNKPAEALEFLTISMLAKSQVFEEILQVEKQKNTAEKLLLEYIGSL